jgi:hypothetical protein
MVSLPPSKKVWSKDIKISFLLKAERQLRATRQSLELSVTWQ